MTTLKTSFVILLMAMIASCDKDPVVRDLYFNPVLAAELLLGPDTFEVGANTLVLQTYLWRDFMPISPPDGKPLISTNQLTDIHSNEVSSDVQLVKQHVINGDLVWTADYSEINAADPLVLEGVSREGPKWGPDIAVDVVSEFVFGGETYRIVARNQEIVATH